MRIECRKEILNIEPYIPGKHIDEVKREFGLTEIIKLASNENPLGASNKVQSTIAESLPHIHQYPDGNSTELRQKLAAHLQCSPNNLIVGNGSDEILKLIGEAYLSPADQVIIAEPTFSEYRFVANLMGAGIKLVPLRQYRHDLESMLAQVNKKTKIVFICNPNNPTGTAVTEQELRKFLSQLPQNILTVIDEAYYEYVTAKEYPQTISLLKQYPNIIITRTFSKVYALAALRIGYAVADNEIIQTLNRVKEPFNVNLIAQIAAEVSLGDKEHVRQSIAVNEQGKQYLYQKLSALGLEYVATEANFILINVKQDANSLFQRLLKKGVIVRSTDCFKLPEHIRVTVGTMEQNQRFIKALEEVL
ncbi:MAG: histidinol-phosphate transaminase [Firmicutes bacterium]|nr:histidinol-phosphate transaminase [Bacillota bacterium]